MAAGARYAAPDAKLVCFEPSVRVRQAMARDQRGRRGRSGYVRFQLGSWVSYVASGDRAGNVGGLQTAATRTKTVGG